MTSRKQLFKISKKFTPNFIYSEHLSHSQIHGQTLIHVLGIHNNHEVRTNKYQSLIILNCSFYEGIISMLYLKHNRRKDYSSINFTSS